MKRFLGEGGKKKVYLAYDTVPDRDVAFASFSSAEDADRVFAIANSSAGGVGNSRFPGMVRLLARALELVSAESKEMAAILSR